MATRRVNLVEFSDLLHHAHKLGIGWNEAHELFEKDEIIPFYELKTKDFCKNEVERNVYCYSKGTQKLILSFMDENMIHEMTMVEG